MQTPVTLTANKIVILRTLENGPVKFSALRKAYFGEARAKQQATTSFYMQTKGMIEKGLVKKTEVGYEATELGLVSIQAVSSEIKAAAKSNAQIAFELLHGTGAVAAAVASTPAEPVEA